MVRFMSRKTREEGNFRPDSPPEQTFTAYIIKGNRQVISRMVTASKRFRVNEETYLIRSESIFLKNIDGKLKSVAYYREGNPNPYSFDGDNTGVTPEELDRIFSEDFHTIVSDLQENNRMFYVLLVVIVTLGLAVAFDVGVGIIAFI